MIRKALKISCIILSVAFFLLVALSVSNILFTSKRFIYNLSKMPRENAREIVLDLYAKNLSQFQIYGVDVSESYIDKKLDEYLDKAESLSPIEKIILEITGKREFGISGIIITISAIILLITYELITAREDEKAFADNSISDCD